LREKQIKQKVYSIFVEANNFSKGKGTQKVKDAPNALEVS